ncbi:protein AKNAD1 isoform X2 [Chiroxiphia lanceolata]|uniref:protein AKNAD1 isoform X2 n=1 Tax=Chiroxiphia lanceolata TaxID=296741 RepID=UPI0013CF2D7A|nr:protein AKNAD1 isoform X2 [Chiroxiphia lanceolata]
METTKKCKPSDWMKTQMNNSFSDALGCSTDVTEEEQHELLYVEITHKYNNNSYHLNDSICTEDISGILNLMCSEDNKYTTANYAAYPQPEEFFSQHRSTEGTMGVSTEMPGSEASFKKEFPVGSSSKPDSKEHLTTSKMSNVLLRHFCEGELLSTCQLIECEMIPESSFTDSIDDTGSEPEPSEHLRGPSLQEQWATTFEEYHLEKHKEVNSGGKNKNVLSENRPVSKKPCTGKCGCRQENSQLINDNEPTHTFQNMKDERGLFKKTVSPCKLQYGQGQTHCCLPDFYEVASEVKVPKRTDNINSVPTTGRAKPFPMLLSKSVTVNHTLENKNYFNSAEVDNKEEMSISEQLQQLKILPQSDFPNASTAISSGDTGTAPGITLDAPIPVQSTHGLLKARLQSGTAASALSAAGMVEAQCPNPSNSLPEQTLGEKMSQILKDQTDQLTKKVEDFSKHMSQETSFLHDKYLALNQLKRYLDALERNYLTAREKHHNLQLQNFKDKSINIGEFDPDRRVEGGIFRLGMLLEDIQEQMDHSKHSLSSLLTSYESAYSSHSFCESSVVSSIADPPERRGTENPFLYKNHEGEKSPTTVIPQTNQLYLEGKNCCLCPHININIQERKTGTSPLFSQRKPTDLSDTNLSSDSEDISVYDSYNDSQSKDLVNCDTQNYKSLNMRLCGERKGLGCRCPRGSRDQVKLRNYKESVQSCALCRNKSPGSSSYSQKRISTKKAQKNKQPCELINRLCERESFEAAKTCCSSTCNKILVSHQYIPSKKFAQSKSAIRKANDSNANILSSTLDHAIQTANSLKKATERMVRAVSEDLAKVKRKPL